MRAAPLLLMSGLLGCAPSVGGVEAAVVYGEDDRREVHAHPSATMRSLAATSVALFDRGALVREGEAFTLPSSFTLGEAQGLCDGERFADQPTAAWCSGILVAPDLVLTAGHCVPDADTCAATELAFDYLYEAPGALASIDRDDVYGCAAVVVQRLDEREDYAVVRLDRPVVGRAPAPVNARAEDPVGSSVTTMGYGSGIPLKIDSGGAVTGPDGAGAFLASVDAFEGHSGGGVFDAGGALVGVLVSGEADYVRAGDCFVPVVRDDAEGAERVQRIEVPLRALCDARPDEIACEGLETGPPPDAGTSPDDPPSGGCDVASSSSASPVGPALLLLALTLRRRRR